MKFLLDAYRYDVRPYESYLPGPRFSTGESLIHVDKNDDLFSPVSGGIGYTALLTVNGQGMPLKHQADGTSFYSKDGAVEAVKGILLPENSTGCLDFLLYENEPLYTYAYDISTHRELYSAAPTKQFSKQIEHLIRQHGGLAKNFQTQAVLIGLGEQEKFERADVTQRLGCLRLSQSDAIKRAGTMLPCVIRL